MSKPRIDIFSPPFPGHLHPILGLARALAEFADIRVLSTPDAAADVQADGLAFHPILRDRVADIWAITNTSGPVRGRPWMLWSQFQKNMQLMPALRADVFAAWRERKPDVALVDFTLPAVGCWARAQGIRWWTSHPSPLAIEAPDGTPSYLGGWKPPAGFAGRARDKIGRSSTRLFKKMVFCLCQKQMTALGMPGVYRDDGSEHAYSDEVLFALGSRELEFPRTWPRATRFVGPLLHTPSARNDAGVELAAGRKNVLVTIGTHLPYARANLLANVRAWATAMPGVFFHYTMGGDTTTQAASGENWRAYPHINYERELCRFDAVVHHGGAGITYHALRSGCPVVVMPQDYDQFDFAARLEHHGLAHWCRKPARLPDALARALRDDERSRAAREHFKKLLTANDTRAHVARVLHEQGLLKGKPRNADASRERRDYRRSNQHWPDF